MFYQSQHSPLPGDFRTLHASVWWRHLCTCRFPLPRGLNTSHYQIVNKLFCGVRTTTKQFAHHFMTMLIWGANSPNLNLTDSTARWEKEDEEVEAEVPQADHLHGTNTVIIDAVICVKRTITKFWVYKWTHFFLQKYAYNNLAYEHYKFLFILLMIAHFIQPAFNHFITVSLKGMTYLYIVSGTGAGVVSFTGDQFRKRRTPGTLEVWLLCL